MSFQTIYAIMITTLIVSIITLKIWLGLSVINMVVTPALGYCKTGTMIDGFTGGEKLFCERSK